MRRESPLTYRGALQLLGRDDPTTLKVLDGLLGGVILAAGAAALAAGAAGTPAVAVLAAVWGMVDQKNEALDLVGRLLAAGRARLRGVRGRSRRELVEAAHTTIVLAAFFEALRDHLGSAAYEALKLTQEEKLGLIVPDRDTTVVAQVFDRPVPMPSARTGFVEHQYELNAHYLRVMDGICRYLERLEAGYRLAGPGGLLARPWASTHESMVTAAIARYDEYYRAFATDAPEFFVWAMLDEHAATRTELRTARADLVAVLERQSTALERMEALLASPVVDWPGSELGETLHLGNRASLGEPLVPGGALGQAGGVRFAQVSEGYVSPAYRLAEHTKQARIADEHWWSEREQYADLDLFLAAYFTSADSTSLPLLVLGHPGAGKSLLTKVLAARLPPDSYTVVRVALRDVDAAAPIHTQVQQAIAATTNGRVDWLTVTRTCPDTHRVVLLDGFDELLHASGGNLSGYLHMVAEYQRQEAELGWPVAVVVTSRTVVADRVRIPDGTLVVRLAEFDEVRIGRWLAVWDRANPTAPRRLTVVTAMTHHELAQHPLLLLLLALYVAEPDTPSLDADMSSAALYGRLLDNFIRREVEARLPTGTDPTGATFAVAMENCRWRLAVAAFAMFNRGRLQVSEDDLGADLHALREADPAGPAPTAGAQRLQGQRTLGQFFFVHTAEADRHRGPESQRSYEFLHATFGEYLIARYTVDLLVATSRARRPGWHGGRVDDDLLFALLSQQSLAARRTTLEFAAALYAQLDPAVRGGVQATLETLAAGAFTRHPTTTYDGYRPQPAHRLRELAAYTANLVLLRTHLGALPIAAITSGSEPLDDWRVLVRLWRAGLDDPGWDATVEALDLDNQAELTVVQRQRWYPEQLAEVAFAQLLGDRDLEIRYRIGAAVHRPFLFWNQPSAPGGVAAFLSFATTTGLHGCDTIVSGVLDDMSMTPEEDQPTAEHLLRFLLTEAGSLPYQQVLPFVRLLVHRLGQRVWCPQLALLLAVQPALITDVPELADPARYTTAPVPHWLLLALDAAAVTAEQQHQVQLDALRKAVVEAIDPDLTDADPALLLKLLLSTRQALDVAQFEALQTQVGAAALVTSAESPSPHRPPQ